MSNRSNLRTGPPARGKSVGNVRVFISIKGVEAADLKPEPSADRAPGEEQKCRKCIGLHGVQKGRGCGHQTGAICGQGHRGGAKE